MKLFDEKDGKPSMDNSAAALVNEIPNNSSKTSVTLEGENDFNEAVKDVVLENFADSVVANDETTLNYLPMGPRLFLIVGSLMLAVFCMALDNTIIAVAIPQITDDFRNLNDVGWYASSYLLTGCSFQLLFGKFYALYSVKWVLLIALFIFEVGSLICGVAPSSTVLIVGRAVAGLGSAGIFTGAFVTIAHTVELEKRPAFIGMIGGVYGVASVAGPLVTLVHRFVVTTLIIVDGGSIY
ncbi:MAG: hypothetical protein Q9164_003115 [Protoblastenia rupestris]